MFISYDPFNFQEDFKCLDIKNIPSGICVEENSRYTQKHVRSEDGKFLFSCKGNKFICNTPALENFKASLCESNSISSRAGEYIINNPSK